MGHIEFATDLGDIDAGQLHGFFVGWPEPPTPEEHLTILRAATHMAVARCADGAVIGFATAISAGRATRRRSFERNQLAPLRPCSPAPEPATEA